MSQQRQPKRNRLIWIAGGFGNILSRKASMTQSPSNNNNNSNGGEGTFEDEIEHRNRLSLLIDQQEKRCPRIFNVIFKILIPLLALVCLAMICGHFLSRLERTQEMEANNAIMAGFLSDNAKIETAVLTTQTTYEVCLSQYTTKYNSTEELQSYMKDCTSNGSINPYEYLSTTVNNPYSLAIVEEIQNTTSGNVIGNGLTFEWNRCGEKNMRWEQGFYVYLKWLDSFFSLLEDYTAEGDVDAYEKAVANASGTDDCTVNSAGGAIFWFTIMTTIGYGNTAPVTRGGRLLVYTVGFLSILAFTVVIGSAATVFLTIVDDLFDRFAFTKRWLIKGWLACALWLSMMLLWILVIAGIAGLYSKAREGDLDTLENRYWFSFISITTVGLGDIFIPHETIHLADMLYVPLLMLMGFVFLGNFLLKLGDTMLDVARKTGIADDETLEYLLKQRHTTTTTSATTTTNNNSNNYDDNNKDVEG